MDVRDYLIDPSAFDWPKLLATWHWRLPPQFTALPILANLESHRA